MKTLIMVMATCIAAMACGQGYFKTSTTQYDKPEYVTNQVGAATNTLVMLGYEIEKANYEVVETKVETLYVGAYPYTIEFQSWIKVFTNAGRIKAYCTQRPLYKRSGGKILEGDMKFIRCTSPTILERVNTVVKELTTRLESGL
jgi:hypothetical protein